MDKIQKMTKQYGDYVRNNMDGFAWELDSTVATSDEELDDKAVLAELTSWRMLWYLQ